LEKRLNNNNITTESTQDSSLSLSTNSSGTSGVRRVIRRLAQLGMAGLDSQERLAVVCGAVDVDFVRQYAIARHFRVEPGKAVDRLQQLDRLGLQPPDACALAYGVGVVPLEAFNAKLLLSVSPKEFISTYAYGWSPSRLCSPSLIIFVATNCMVLSDHAVTTTNIMSLLQDDAWLGMLRVPELYPYMARAPRAAVERALYGSGTLRAWTFMIQHEWTQVSNLDDVRRMQINAWTHGKLDTLQHLLTHETRHDILADCLTHGNGDAVRWWLSRHVAASATSNSTSSLVAILGRVTNKHLCLGNGAINVLSAAPHYVDQAMMDRIACSWTSTTRGSMQPFVDAVGIYPSLGGVMHCDDGMLRLALRNPQVTPAHVQQTMIELEAMIAEEEGDEDLKFNRMLLEEWLNRRLNAATEFGEPDGSSDSDGSSERDSE